MYFSEWHPEQYAMKLRAPRCNDGRSATSFSAWRSQPARPPSFANAPPAPNNSAAAPTTESLLVRMVSHSIGNRTIAVGLRHERQQDEEREVQRDADARHERVRGFRRLQAEPHERQEHREE